MNRAVTNGSITLFFSGSDMMENNRLAIEYIEKQDFKKAAELLDEAISKKPKDPLGYINFGNLLIHMNDYERGRRFFERAIELDGEAATAYYGLGNLYYQQESYEKAQKNYQKAIQLGLDDGDVYYMLGMTFKNNEQDLLGLPYFMRATELNPGDNESLFQYGLTLAQTNHLVEAQEVFEKILASDEKHADAHYNLGVIALIKDKAEEGLQHFEQALAIQPDHLLAKNGKREVLKALEE